MDYWQIAAGYFGRDYAESFLRFGIAFVGGENQVATLEQVALGDVLVLKRGVTEILAAGRVVERDGQWKGNGDKPWLWDFDGWELPAYCYVEWHKPENPEACNGLARGTIVRSYQEPVRNVADRLLLLPAIPVSAEPQPAEPLTLTDKEILEFLIKQGLRPAAADEVTRAFNHIRLLAHYYYGQVNWEDIREHETRTFLIMPLLLALGWSEQQLKIELPAGSGRRADVACFAKPYRRTNRDGQWLPNDEDCVVILESKGYSSGLDYAPEQAKAYAENFPKCHVVVVSNGYCYKTYERLGDGGFNTKTPSAYLNIIRPQRRYPLDPANVAGGLEVLSHLLPP